MKATTKHVRAHMQNVNFDWISSLPAELLIRILSFLTTKEAVQTCILSKRWTRVWANLPILKFNINEFRVDDSIGAGDEAFRKSIARFEQFVSGVVKKLDSTQLDRVCYVHENDTKPPYFYKVPMQWLDRVALLMPQLIDISIIGVKSVEFPDSLFSCATLQHLKIKLLHVKKSTVIPASINLPSLKVFDVSLVVLPENFPQNLFMGCPSLETLKLCVRKLHCSSISSNTLRELFIAGYRQSEPIQVSCPSLFSLHIVPYLRGGASISMKNMKFLRTACIALTSVAQHFGGGDVPVLNILGGLSSATKLHLFIDSPELKVPLERDILNCRNFNNVKELLIGIGGMSFDFNLVASLLKLSPNVEKLTLVLDVNQIAIHEEHMQEDLGDVLFQHKYIEIIKIHDWHKRELPEDFLKTFIKTLNAYVKEIGNVIIE